MENHEMNLLSLINLSLDIVYCSMILFNHYIIKFFKFVSRFYSSYENFWKLNRPMSQTRAEQ